MVSAHSYYILPISCYQLDYSGIRFFIVPLTTEEFRYHSQSSYLKKKISNSLYLSGLHWLYQVDLLQTTNDLELTKFTDKHTGCKQISKASILMTCLQYSSNIYSIHIPPTAISYDDYSHSLTLFISSFPLPSNPWIL